jgi:hypothetical protein
MASVENYSRVQATGRKMKWKFKYCLFGVDMIYLSKPSAMATNIGLDYDFCSKYKISQFIWLSNNLQNVNISFKDSCS